jgi:light-regulated signal transduction histidine kinase (bacteriophytochrome)
MWLNLILNAIKYSFNREDAQIEISSDKMENKTIYRVMNNGVGFNMRYSDKQFGVFQRCRKNLILMEPAWVSV